MPLIHYLQIVVYWDNMVWGYSIVRGYIVHETSFLLIFVLKLMIKWLFGTGSARTLTIFH